MRPLRRYADWTRRRAGTAQCSPALGVLAVIVFAAVTCYIYREVILTTIEVAVMAAVGTAILTGAVAFTVNTLRWYRKRAKLMAADPSGAVALATATSDADAKAISDEADLLADKGMELVFDKDGNLRAGKAPAP